MPRAPGYLVFAAIVLMPNLGAASDQDAILAQTASALASADYAKRNCPHLKVDEQLILRNAAEVNATLDDLRETESYEEQVEALERVEQTNGRDMVCMVMPAAHGGFADGIIGTH